MGCMMPGTRYIVAMLASKPTYFVDYAQRNFAGKEANYILGEHAKPHVTLVQFYGDHNDASAVKDFIELLSDNPQPRYTGIQFGIDVNDSAALWANMGVARDPALLELHLKMVDFLKSRNLHALNDSGDLYYPHVTFARVKIDGIGCEKPNIPDVVFNLALGVADEFGQFVKVLWVAESRIATEYRTLGLRFSKPQSKM